MENDSKIILVVEDDQSLSTAIKNKLQKNNFQVTTARTVEQAFDYLSNISNIDAIWLDHYLLGKENGIDFVKKIKSNDSNLKNIPIFVVSNTVGPDKVKTYLQLGVAKYYIKAEKKLEDIIADIKLSI